MSHAIESDAALVVVPEGFVLTERHRLDLPTKERLEECAGRKKRTVAALIRMAVSYWSKIYNDPQTEPLAYERQSKSEHVNVKALVMREGTEDDLCAICHRFLDDKDDGADNQSGSAHLPQMQGDDQGGYTTALQPTIRRETTGFVCGVSRTAMDKYVYSFCSPRQPVNLFHRELPISKIGYESVSCPACQAILEAARAFPILQYTQLQPTTPNP